MAISSKKIKTSYGEDQIKVPRDREGSNVINKTIYIGVGLRIDGTKEVLGLWFGKNEPSSFSMSVLTDIKAHGTKDMLNTATDNLNGFT